jgi:trehalose/maltose hydrolase-like predicted phosphorylase
VHAQLANIINDSNLSWELYEDALTSDYKDIQGGTTAEGIHAGVMAGTVMIAISTFAGVDLRGELLKVSPSLPKHWEKLEFSLVFKNTNYNFAISHKGVELVTDKDSELIVFGKKVTTKEGEKATF